ncbi:MAG: hypothetical protein ACK4V2_00395 [Pseudomonadota bacterium]|jgi:hypothetical protein|nr:hypothetical protein [Alphaproteobacteria bacterium]
MRNFKVFTLILAALGLFSVLSASETDESNAQQGVVLRVWNHDIGPVIGGKFLEDQEGVNKLTRGKCPGSGLFRIPYESENGFWEQGLSALHDLKILVEVTLKDSTKKLFSERLLLPGKYIEIPTNTNSIEDIKIKIQSRLHNYSTSAGGMWVAQWPATISKTLCIGSESIQHDGTLEVIASWPRVLSKTQQKALLFVELHEDEEGHAYVPLVTSQDQLDPVWKRTIGMRIDYHDTEAKFGYCFPTDSLNRKNMSGNAVQYAKDLLNLGENFPYYAGHQLLNDLFGEEGSSDLKEILDLQETEKRCLEYLAKQERNL